MTEKVKNGKVVDMEKRKRPGRPRKTPVREPVEKKGVVQTPKKVTNAMELIYDEPESIKKIFTMFKSMAVNVIKMTFEATRVVFRTTDHLEMSTINVILNTQKMNHYYCRVPYTIMINPKNMERVIRILDKSYITVAFVSKISELKKKLHIIYKNDMKIDEYRDFNLIDVTGNHTPNVEISDAGYQIKFTMPSRFFKKMIGDVSSFSDTLTFEKTGDGPLSYSYMNIDNTLKSKHVVKDPVKIDLVCKMESDDIFGSTIVLDYIKALSGSLLAENITISADSNHPMIFQSVINGGDIRVKIQTVTVNNRDEVR